MSFEGHVASVVKVCDCYTSLLMANVREQGTMANTDGPEGGNSRVWYVVSASLTEMLYGD
jgi:hypothetical protein